MFDEPKADGPRTQGERDFAFVGRIDRVVVPPLRFIRDGVGYDVTKHLETESSLLNAPEEPLSWVSARFSICRAGDTLKDWFYAGQLRLERDTAHELFLEGDQSQAQAALDEFEDCTITIAAGNGGDIAPYGFLRQPEYAEVMLDVIRELTDRAGHAVAIVRTSEPSLAFAIAAKTAASVDISFAYSDSWDRSLQVAGPGGEDRAAVYEALASRSRDNFGRALQAVYDFNNLRRGGERDDVPVAQFRLSFPVASNTMRRDATIRDLSASEVEESPSGPSWRDVLVSQFDFELAKPGVEGDLEGSDSDFYARATGLLGAATRLQLGDDVFIGQSYSEVTFAGVGDDTNQSQRRARQIFSVEVDRPDIKGVAYECVVSLSEPRISADDFLGGVLEQGVHEPTRGPMVAIEVARGWALDVRSPGDLSERAAIADAAAQICVDVLRSSGEVDGFLTTNDATFAQAVARRRDCRRAEVLVGSPDVATLIEGGTLARDFNLLLSREIGQRSTIDARELLKLPADVIPQLFDSCNGELDAQFNFYFARV